jgi:glutathione peroxidase
MFDKMIKTIAIAIGAVAPVFVAGSVLANECPAFLNQDFRKLRSSESVNLCKLIDGKPALIVNTASHCGFTPQFKGLEALHEKYKDRGLVVIGFPSDSFHQESSDDAETAEVCYMNYGVKFTMLKESSVKGADSNPVFKVLAARTEAPSWNFNKYLVSADGTSIKHYGSTVAPDAAKLRKDIEAMLPTKAAP